VSEGSFAVSNQHAAYGVISCYLAANCIDAQDLANHINTILRNNRTDHRPVLVALYQIASGVDAALHHDYIAEACEFVEFPLSGDICDGDAPAVPSKKAAEQRRATHEERMHLHVEGGCQLFYSRIVERAGVKQDVAHHGQVDPDLRVAKYVSSCYRHRSPHLVVLNYGSASNIVIGAGRRRVAQRRTFPWALAPQY
ncbi:uncharacterized protein METZ01_LOCUS44282, partial [marine metagenome]